MSCGDFHTIFICGSYQGENEVISFGTFIREDFSVEQREGENRYNQLGFTIENAIETKNPQSGNCFVVFTFSDQLVNSEVL